MSNQLQSVAYAALGVDLASYDAAVFGSSSQATGNYSLVAPAVVAVQAANTQVSGSGGSAQVTLIQTALWHSRCTAVTLASLCR